MKPSALLFTFCLTFIFSTFVYSQSSTPFWTPGMQSIAKPTSQAGWIQIKNDVDIQQGTLFTFYKQAFGLGVDDQMDLTDSMTDNMAFALKKYPHFSKTSIRESSLHHLTL